MPGASSPPPPPLPPAPPLPSSVPPPSAKRRASRSHAGSRTAASPPRGATYAPSQPLEPPPLPPVNADAAVDRPVRIFPTRGASSSGVKQLIQSLHASSSTGAPGVVVVGILGAHVTNSAGLYTFVNKVVGRHVFTELEEEDSALNYASPLLSSIQLVYDERRGVAFLVGVAKPDGAVLDLFAQQQHRDDSDGQDLSAFLETAEQERLNMELLLYTSCHQLFYFTEHGRFTPALLKHARLLAGEKASLQAQLSSAGSKPSKRDKAAPISSSTTMSNALAPGRCVPMVQFVVPAREEVLRPPTANAAFKTRSAAVTYCKAHEAMLTTLFRSLRGGIVGSVRSRDVLTPATLSKDRRLFNIDPSHCVVVISRTAATAQGDLEHRFAAVIEALLSTTAMATTPDTFDLDTALQPLVEDDVGFPHAVQHVNRFVEMARHLPHYGSSGKDSSNSSSGSGMRAELLPLATWLKAFHSVVKAQQKLEARRRQDAAADLLVEMR
ncbi:hypothetical protein PINS_up010055 [Pythium insidiosum]|nr:hypothetical protein PINS_up010055 [Pythium insidiosum]